MIVVTNPEYPNTEIYYTVSPRDAAIAAYAQMKRHDYATWHYEERYGRLAHQDADGNWTVGGWIAREEPNAN